MLGHGTEFDACLWLSLLGCAYDRLKPASRKINGEERMSA